MQIATQIAAFLHVLAAMYWTGAILFLAAVGNPLLNIVRPPSFQRELSRRFWMAAHRSMWIAVGILVATGVLMLYARGALGAQMFSMGYLETQMGRKIAVTVFMVGLSIVHDLLLGPGARLRDPRASTDPPGFIGRFAPWMIALGGVAATLLSLAPAASR